MNPSISSIPLSRSCLYKALSTFFSVPVLAHFWNLRKHVAYEGYRDGRSFHGAPVRRTHNTPFSTSRGSRQGRPRPSLRTRGFGKNGATRSHCSSVRSMRIVDQNSNPKSIPSGFRSNFQYLARPFMKWPLVSTRTPVRAPLEAGPVESISTGFERLKRQQHAAFLGSSLVDRVRARGWIRRPPAWMR